MNTSRGFGQVRERIKSCSEKRNVAFHGWVPNGEAREIRSDLVWFGAIFNPHLFEGFALALHHPLCVALVSNHSVPVWL